ncbi:MAG: SAM-dependent methyltransferase [Gammaproteobacteria bacterium]|nr:SAM-dependent methyltransferase [Gammaproteobacteria bacterium]
MRPTSIEHTLPRPDEASLARSRALAARIRDAIAEAGGWIGFEQYVQLALYEPGLGYYSADGEKIGIGGDFVTAPELSNALARAIAATCAPWLESLPSPTILELGAGHGTLAAQCLDAFEVLGLTNVRYLILETSGTLRQRQQETLARYAGRVEWLDGLLDTELEGLILANEVADALPFERFVKRGDDVVPLGVRVREDGFDWAEGGRDPTLSRAVRRIEASLGMPLPEGYRSELRLVLPAWIATLGACLLRGAMLLVDYGYARRDYYRPDRSGGTLMCHYRHRAHGDPFVYPGLQDITAWVDFSACAEAGRAAGLSVAGFTTQAQFLIEALGDALIGERDRESPARLAALKTLILPGEMGERFKLLLLTRRADGLALPGRDFRSRL